MGKSAIPNGDAFNAFERIQLKFKQSGLYIIEDGELESFAKGVGNKGPKWLNNVLLKNLKIDPSLAKARKFVNEITSY